MKTLDAVEKLISEANFDQAELEEQFRKLDELLEAVKQEFDRSRHTAIADSLGGLEHNLLSLVHQQREAFIKELSSVVSRLTGSSDELKELAEQTLSVLRDRNVAESHQLSNTSEDVDLDRWTQIQGSLEELSDTFDGRLKGFEQALDRMSPADRSAGRNLLETWRTEVSVSLGRPVKQPEETTRDLADIVGTTSSLDSADGESRSVMEELLGGKSGLVPQVLAALEPQTRQEILSRLRLYRELTVQKPHAWILRSQARVFGWNAPSDAPVKVEGEIHPPAHQNPLINTGVEQRDAIFLDGDFSNTANSSVVLIRKGALEPILARRINSVTPITRSDYGISNSSTRLELDGAPWWSISTAENIGSLIVNDEMVEAFGEPDGIPLQVRLIPLGLDFTETRIATLKQGEEWVLFDNRTLINAKLLEDQEPKQIVFTAAATEIGRVKIPKSAKVEDEIKSIIKATGRPGSGELTAFPETGDAKTAWRTSENTNPSYTALLTDDGKTLRVYRYDPFDVIRTTKVWCDAESLEIASDFLVHKSSVGVGNADERAILRPSDDKSQEIELEGFYPYLTTQSKLLIRAVPYAPNPDWNPEDGDEPIGDAEVSELASILGVKHDSRQFYGERIHTTITLARPLSRDYWLKGFRIYANVVEATHGETVDEIIGSGDGSQPNQRMPLSAAPLTRIPASNFNGESPQLEVNVNKVRWERKQQLSNLNGNVEAYEVSQSRSGETAIQFGDGEHGHRLPSGNENVQAKYRVGIGTNGNVDADRIDQLPSPPLGVRNVTNPMRSSGGADRDSLAQTRTRAGVAASRLSRLISAADYKSFALSYAGVDKADARIENDLIVVTVAGPLPEPVPRGSALMRNLVDAIREIGDPEAQFLILPHRSLLIFLQANIKIDSRYQWEDVEIRARSALFEAFAYRVRDLNQDVLRSEITRVIQGVEGIVYVDIDKLAPLDQKTVNQKDVRNLKRIRLPRDLNSDLDARPSETDEAGADGASQRILEPRPAEICFLNPAAPDTLIMEQIR